MLKDEAVWVPIYTGKRRDGRCSTRRHKTHNKKALRYLRRVKRETGKSLWELFLTGQHGTWHGFKMAEPIFDDAMPVAPVPPVAESQP